MYSGTATLNVVFVPVKFTIKFEAWRTSALAGRVNFAVSAATSTMKRCTDIPWTMACQGGAMYIASDATPCWSQFTGEVKNMRITYYDWSKRMRVRFEHPLLTSQRRLVGLLPLPLHRGDRLRDSARSRCAGGSARLSSS